MVRNSRCMKSNNRRGICLDLIHKINDQIISLEITQLNQSGEQVAGLHHNIFSGHELKQLNK